MGSAVSRCEEQQEGEGLPELAGVQVAKKVRNSKVWYLGDWNRKSVLSPRGQQTLDKVALVPCP